MDNKKQGLEGVESGQMGVKRMEELSRKEGAGREVTGAAKGWQGQRSAFDFGHQEAT